jgi:hypothetical protein
MGASTPTQFEQTATRSGKTDRKLRSDSGCVLERVKGIEPSSSAWKADLFVGYSIEDMACTRLLLIRT